MNDLRERALKVLGFKKQSNSYTGEEVYPGFAYFLNTATGVVHVGTPSDAELIGLLESWLDGNLRIWGCSKWAENRFNLWGACTENRAMSESADTRLEALVCAVEAAKKEEASNVQP